MTPIPQEHAGPDVMPSKEDGNRIVISGMSGLYPQSNNVKEFSDILYNKVNPVTSGSLRFKYNHPEVVQYSGTIPDLNRFDAQFFKVNFRLSNAMDSMSRKLLEQTYQAIYDAGVNPEELSGKKVGVYIGSSFSETDKVCQYKSTSSGTGLGIAGCSKSMFANRISYWLNTRGPSVSIEEACCSSTAALEQAYLALSHGLCESAIVGGSYLCIHPQSSVHYSRVIRMCNDGKTKSFDEAADGCAKSEAISVLFLQKAKDALRIYADVLYVKNEFICTGDEKTPLELGFYRNINDTTNFIKNFYKEAGVPPQAVEYVEAFGSATPQADKVELQTIEEIFCENRSNTLMVGSVMSNIGFAEAASGISAITKVLLGYHSGELAANLHCKQPRKDIVSLRTGRMRILTEHQRFGRTYVAVNGMSVTGVNSHVLLHGCYRPKDLNRYETTLPYLVAISGRNKEAVKYLLEILKSNSVDAEQLALLHNIHRLPISGHLSRGYVILETDNEQKTISLSEKVNYFDTSRRPLWFVYSGMGSQWAGMGKELMRIPIFAAAIERCRRALEPTGLDIVTIITSPDQNIFNNILHSFVGIAAIQVGLTDVLHELGLKPDGIIGHSVGELGCAYADGCLTAEEMILSAYYRGLVSLETSFIHGSMAAIGLGYEQISKICPPEIVVACHNGPESSTISGPSDIMRDFVMKLTSKGIFAKEVPCSNIAYHSRYIADAGPGLLKYLKALIKTPKARGERWLSTSIPKVRWNEPIAKLCSAEYLTNNLLNPVLFEETSRLLPADAVLVEIAPHGLLQAILKRSMPSSCINIPLTRRKHPDPIIFLLEAIGQLYLEGFNSNLQALYPKVKMPVTTGTPFLSHLIKWAHEEKWPLPLYRAANRKTATNCNFTLTIHDKEHNYLTGNLIRGNLLYPYAASLILAWDTLAMILESKKKELSVTFKDIQLYAQPILHDRRQLKLNVSIQRGGAFEILDGSSMIIKGFIEPSGDQQHVMKNETENMFFTAEDIYQLLRDRDYFYSGEFQSIECADKTLSEAMLVWRDNWVTFIDGMLQMNVLRQPHDAVSQPISIGRLNINVKNHNRAIVNSKVLNGKVLLNAYVSDQFNRTRSGGIVMECVKFEHLPHMNDTKIILKSTDFEPNVKCKFGPLISEDTAVKESTMTSENVTLKIEQFGDYDSLKWVQAPKLTGVGVTVNIHYAGINNNDMKKANGALFFRQTINNSFGMDFSGVTESGQPVMGIVRSGGASTQVRVQPEMLWPVPAHWSLEDAATVPLAYMQAFYMLGNTLTRGNSVLIHGGAGALGQALISIALAHDCEVFTTVSDIRKKKFLQRLFPALKADQIGCSRDQTFADMIQTASNDKKCGIVVSCVSGYLKDISIECTQMGGVFFDISQIENLEDYNFGMSHLFQCKNYHSIDFSTMLEASNNDTIKVMHKMISDGIARGYVRPLTRVTYTPCDIARAFQVLAASSHRGRVLLRLKEDALEAQFRFSCSADHCYLIICHNTMFGVQLSDKLVARGAKRLYVHVPKTSPYLQHKNRSLRKLGINVVESFGYLNNPETVTSLVNNALKSGPLEGVFVSVGEKSDDINHNLISNLDAEIRKRCSDLRYFVVINFGDSASGKNVCLDRLRHQLPATVLMIPELKHELNKSSEGWYCAADVVERVLQSNHGFFHTHIESEPKPSLLKQIATVTGINIPENVAKNLTLEELGLQNHKLKALCTFLRVQYNLAFDEEQVSLLTINQILKVEKTVKRFVPEDTKGLSSFFSNIEADELLGTTEIVYLSTLVSTALMRDDEVQLNKKHLCIVPGMEGQHGRFRDLCERLKIPALVLQPGLDHPHETVPELAKRLSEVLLKKVGMQDTFYLCGYESGIAIALEIAAILENHGLTGKVFCIGCAPDELRNEINEQLAAFKDEEQLEDGVLRHMYTLMTGCEDSTVLDHVLKDLNTWSRKIDACVRNLLGRVPHSIQYAQSFIECALLRIKQARNYSFSPVSLRSQVILLRADIGRGELQHTVLQHNSKEPLVVYQLDSSLAHAATDLRCATIINEHLDPAILEDFANKNICTTYIQDSDSFKTMGN